MSEIVARAALAAKRVLNGNARDDFKGVLTDATLQAMARAVIESMHEPTAAMIEEGEFDMFEDHAPDESSKLDAASVWRAMVSEALV